MYIFQLGRSSKFVLILLYLILFPVTSVTSAVKVAVIQYEVKDLDQVGVDADRLEEYIREAALNGAQLVVTPETCFYRYEPWEQNGVTILDLASHYSDLKSQFSSLAKELKISLVIGLREPSGDRGKPVFNTALFIGPDGLVLGKQHKLVPSDKEKAWTKSGTFQPVFDTPVGRVGMMICKTAKTDRWNIFQKDRNLDLFILIAGDNNAVSFDKFSTICNEGKCFGVLANQITGPKDTGKKGNSAWGYPDGSVSFLGNREQIFYTELPIRIKDTYGAYKGQIISDPNYPDKMVYNKDVNQDGQLDPFFLCGPGDPEGFLFRGKRNPDGTRDGDQMKIIHKLEQNGGNCIYMISVRTNGGDAWKDKYNEPDVYPDDLHNPWIEQNPKNGLNEKILGQWEDWFTEMDKNNIVIYFFIYDDAINVAKQFGWYLDDAGNLNPQEKEFVQALVNRFKHHKNLIWCVMEEGQEIGENWQQHISGIAGAIDEADGHHHLIAGHQLGGNVFFHKNDNHIHQFALQTDKAKVNTTNDLHQWILMAYENSEGQYSLVMSEDWVHGNRSVPNGDRKEIRQRNWAAAMAAAYPMVLGMDIANTPITWLHDCRILQTFFESTTFSQMRPNDLLSHGETEYIQANEGYDYILYSSHCKDNLGIKYLTGGTYTMTWLDCIGGTRKVIKNVCINRGSQIWEKPSGIGNEAALYILREDKRPEMKITSVTKMRIGEKKKWDNIAPNAESYLIEVTRNSSKDVQLRYTDDEGGPGPYSVEIISGPEHGVLSGIGNDKIYMPYENYVGDDEFLWKVNDGESDSAIATIKIIIR